MFHTAVHLINRLPTLVLHHVSTFKKIYNLSPDYHLLKVFGSACFPLLRPYNKHKFHFHSDKCVFIGYSDAYKGFKCLHHSGRI